MSIEIDERYGLESLGEVEWLQASYGYDFTAVWRSLTDPDELFRYDDRGCSCSVPLEARVQEVLLRRDQQSAQAQAQAQVYDMMKRVVN